MNPANLLTVFRVALIPVFVIALYTAGTPTVMTTAAWLAVAAFVVASLTDSFDGMVARRYGTITSVGELLDPFADKLLVAAALTSLVALREFPLWAALLIGIREISVSVWRSFALRRGEVLAAKLPGKIKTAIQLPMVVIWIFPRQGNWIILQDVALYLGVIATVASGLFYLLQRPSKSPQVHAN